LKGKGVPECLFLAIEGHDELDELVVFGFDAEESDAHGWLLYDVRRLYYMWAGYLIISDISEPHTKKAVWLCPSGEINSSTI
jgi:hypothetical protein